MLVICLMGRSFLLVRGCGVVHILFCVGFHVCLGVCFPSSLENDLRKSPR